MSKFLLFGDWQYVDSPHVLHCSGAEAVRVENGSPDVFGFLPGSPVAGMQVRPAKCLTDNPPLIVNGVDDMFAVMVPGLPGPAVVVLVAGDPMESMFQVYQPDPMPLAQALRVGQAISLAVGLVGKLKVCGSLDA